MNYLLDTHTLIWVLDNNPSISPKSLDIIENTQNKIFVSVVSIWEISIKKALEKLDFEGIAVEELPKYLEEMLFDVLPLNLVDTASFHKLEAYYHKDPFDRMLIWQSINNNYLLITRDEQIKQYEQVGLKTVW